MLNNDQMQPISPLPRLVVMVAMVVTCFAWTQARAMSLNDAIHQTLATHPEILSARAEEEAAAQDVKESQGGYLPSLEIFAGFGKENTDNPATRATGRGDRTFTRQESEFQLRQLIWDGGFVKSQVAERKALQNRSGFQVSEDRERLAFEAAQAYLNIKRNQELVGVSERDVHAHLESLAKVRRRLQAGAGRRSEIDLVESRLALSRARLERARGELADSRATYFKVVGSHAGKTLTMPRKITNMPRNLTQAQQTALQSNPTIAAFHADFQASHHAIGSVKAAFYPTFTFDVEGSFNDDLDGIKGYSNDLLALVRMQYNLFRGGSDRARVRAAKEREAAARFALENTKRDINEDVALAWNEWQTAVNRIPHLRSHRDEALQVFQAYQKQFQLGQRTLFDLLNAEVEYFDAKRDLIDGRYDDLISRYRVLSGMGRLVATLAKSEHERRDNRTQLPSEPSSASAKGGIETRHVASVATVAKHEAKSAKPVTTTVKAGKPTAKPVTTTVKAGKPTAKPVTTTVKAGKPTAKPVTTTVKAGKPTAKPVTTTVKAGKPTAKPVTTTVKAGKPTAKPVTTTAKAGKPTAKPVATTVKVNEPTAKSTTTTAKAGKPTTTPVTTIAKVDKPTAKSVTTTAEMAKTNKHVKTPRVSHGALKIHPKSGHYTLQVMASPDKSAVEQFVRNNHLENKVKGYTASINGKTWYRLIYGDYATAEQARDAIKALPSTLQTLHPVVRDLAVLESQLSKRA